MARAPIKLTLYDPETQEEKRTLTAMYIPWKLLKKAIKLQNLDQNNLTEEDVNAITAIVVEAFNHRVTAEELDEGSDTGEMLAVITAIVTHAKGGTVNPTPPGN